MARIEVVITLLKELMEVVEEQNETIDRLFALVDQIDNRV
tara:strand:- start:21403 stop:21522 length:120 start_codon:yes stop_codon:yes gene_type:complete